MVAPPRKHRTRRQDGFTIAELAATLSLVGLVMAVGVPNLGEVLKSYELRTASYELYAELQWMRSASITSNTSYRLTLSGSGIGDYEKFDVSTGSWISVAREVPLGLSAVEVSGPAQIVFRPNGSASSAASFYVYTSKTASKALSVSAAGSIRIG